MLPSSTVENYLKAIYLGAMSLTPPQRLVPMGHLSSALGVVPGTATTMVKALAESGLLEYEPYAGVALTPAGEKLAALVLRRHRLIELFLVRVMGYGWDEVHEEPEQLEHVVSERLIDRMDEMLGRPEVDPHGDPIPTADGHIKRQEAQSLMTCPIGTPVTVMRVVDQDRSFLRFLEKHLPFGNRSRTGGQALHSGKEFGEGLGNASGARAGGAIPVDGLLQRGQRLFEPLLTRLE